MVIDDEDYEPDPAEAMKDDFVDSDFDQDVGDEAEYLTDHALGYRGASVEGTMTNQILS